MATTAFTIHQVPDRDFDAWLALRNQAHPWAADRERFAFSESLRPPDEPRLLLAAWASDGTLAATAECAVGEDGERWIDRAECFIMVAPNQRHRGLGGRLAEEIEAFAQQQRIRWLEAIMLDREEPHGKPFLEHRGFVETERYRASSQDPAAVSLEGLDQLRGSLQRAGIQTAAFSEVDTPEARQALYRCAMAIHRDMPHEPNADWQNAPLDTWLRYVLTSPGASADTMFVALDGDQVVGLTYLIKTPDGNAEVGDTGVIRSHRRRGIARCLKMMATRYAAQHGIRKVQTDNRADNAGMLAINRALGFIPAETILIFEKTLAR